MLVKLVLKNLPEWVALSKPERGYVERKCVDALSSRWQIQVLDLLLKLSLFVPAIVDWSKPTWPHPAACFIAAFLIYTALDEIKDAIVVKFNMGKIRDFIESNQSRLRAVAKVNA
jgi:hypothetical protein